MSAIIPKKFGSQKLLLKGRVTIIDFICIIVFLLISIAIAVPLTIVGWVVQFIIAIIIFTTLLVFLLPNKKTGMRLYNLIYLYFKFKSSNKQYKIGAKSLDTMLLIPYEKLVGEINEVGIIKTSELYKNTAFYISAVEIEGFNLLNLNYEEQERKIASLKLLYANLDVDCSLVKIEKSFNKLTGSKYLNDKINDLRKINLTEKQLNSRITQLKANLELFSNDDIGENAADNFQHKYYLFLYNKSFKSVKENFWSLETKAQNVGLSLHKLNGYEIVNTINHLLYPFMKDYLEEEIIEYKDNLKDLLKMSEFNIYKNSIKLGDLHYSINAIRDYPKFPERCWMLPLMMDDSSVVINISALDKHKIKKGLESAILNLSSNINILSRKEIIAEKELQQELDIYNEIANGLGYGNETMKSMGIYILNYGLNKKDLENKFKLMNDTLRDNEFVLDNLTFRQFQGFSAILPKPTDPLSLTYKREVPSTTLAEGFPFITNEVNDENGFNIGENLMGNPVILDQFKLTSNRKNHNMMILGTSGSGKSTFAKLLLNYHISVGRKIIVIDPEREYKNVCDYHDGNWIDVGNGTKGRINPLQIFTTIDESLNADSKTIITNHISFLSGWFEVLFPDVDKKVVRCFTKYCAEMYESWANDKDLKNVTELKFNEYPIINDLIKFIEAMKKIKDDVRVENELLSLLKAEFQNYGQFSTLYNGHSTITKSSNPFVLFDINTLFEKGQTNVIQAQLYLITAFIANEVNDNFLNDDKECFVLIDEAHLLIDKDKPIALNFIYQMVKRIRKKRGALTLITQNPEDFLGSEDVRKKTQAMLNNVQYQMIMNLSSQNIKVIAEMYENYGDGLTQPELDGIAGAKVGVGLLMISSFERHIIAVKVNEEQKKVFGIKEIKRNVS